MSDTPQRKLVLTGFMGTGKTTLGRLVAEKVGVPFVDLDDVIVQKVGLSIPEIFEKYGEAGFRAWESAVCAEVAADPRVMVVATGGGALLNPTNRQACEKDIVICLFASPETIYERLKDQTDRPLLQVENPQERIAQLIKQRESIYQSFTNGLFISSRGHHQTVEDHLNELRDGLIKWWHGIDERRQDELRVRTPEGSYPIKIGNGLLQSTRDLIVTYIDDLRWYLGIVADSNTAELYGEQVAEHLLEPWGCLVTMPAGESHKNLDTVAQLCRDFGKYSLDRGSIVVALGGGVVGDTAGFAAATYMRGVKLVQIPTTLLAMVDSSVGGKVGVDIPQGKNLVGAFKQPDLVIIDPEVLKTLPPEEMSAGMAEVIKHGLIANPALLDENMPLVEKIKAAVQVKIDIVQRDPYEQGERAHLNLGHTFAHAIEQVSGYTWRHGFAVGVGLVGAAMLSQKLGYLDGDDVGFIEHKVKSAGLPIRYQGLSPDALWEAMKLDKKWRGGRSHFVILKGIGNPAVVSDVPRETILEILEMLRDG
ncbi:MAG: 3-dehydroquinate synthase [Anaerolineae bacterium]|nr:3-dehydroquinate synthase [Anaerolineae bacterium]